MWFRCLVKYPEYLSFTELFCCLLESHFASRRLRDVLLYPSWRRNLQWRMSQATKRKHVVKEVLGDFVTPTENQQIVKVIGSRGNNLHETITAQGETFLVSMPTKFRKNIWIKRGDYVIVDPIEEGEKVKAEISVILYKDHIQYLQKQQLWPEGFMLEQQAQDKINKEHEKEEGEKDEEVSDSDDDDGDLFVNTNRCNYQYSESEDEEDSEDEEEDKETRTENGSFLQQRGN